MGVIDLSAAPSVVGLERGTSDLVMDRLFPPSNPWEKNPIGWTRSRLNEFLWSKQRRICRSVVHNRYTAVHSCHDSGKSFTASRIAAWWIDAHIPGDAFVITTAPTTHQVDAILWREIGRAHRKGNLVGRITLDSKWRLGPAYGEELVAYGRKPADYDPEAFQGLHQTYVLVVIDEANGVPKVMYDAIDTLVTNENARVLAIGNPDSPTSHFASVCKKGSDWNVIHIDGYSTPNFTGERVPDRLRDDLLSVTWVNERKVRWGTRSPLWMSKVRGLFPTTADDALIQQDWWESAASRQLDPGGYAGQLGGDVARYGEDDSLCYLFIGGQLRILWRASKQATTVTAKKFAETMRAMPSTSAMIDGTGVGGGVVDQLKDWDLSVWEFISSAKPTDNRFANLRSEAYWHLRELFEYGMIDVDPKDEELQNQLTSMKWGLNGKGQIQVETKEEYMKRLRVKSPDHADGAMMAAFSGENTVIADHTDTPAVTSDILDIVW